MSRCLVTGGAGFIGSHIVDRLLDEGNEVCVVDNESSNSNEEFYWNSNCHNYKSDISDYKSITKPFREFRPEYVFHLAAYARIPPSIKNPILACENNFIGTCNVLQLSRFYKIKRVMYSSTSSAYGHNEPPHKEDMHRDCLNPYSVSKVAAEDLCKMYNSLYGLETVIFRYFNVYGERQPLKGQYAPLIGIFLRQKQNLEPLTVVGDGKQRRDFTNVKDVVNANILAKNSNNKEIAGEIFNVGTGRNHSVLEIAKIIGGEISYLPPRKGEAKETLADITKIKKMLNYEPTVKLEDYLNNVYN
tara:strand:+ start:56271 stop:57176 length:906 start_codon:yes stop_codon:yes gene_type:complete